MTEKMYNNTNKCVVMISNCVKSTVTLEINQPLVHCIFEVINTNITYVESNDKHKWRPEKDMLPEKAKNKIKNNDGYIGF